MSSPLMYRAAAISKVLNGKTILSDIDFACEPGTAVAIVGPNGAGKSVFLRALAMVDPPTTGTIEVSGTTYRFPVTEGKVSVPWPELTMVFQQLFLWPHLTILDNIALPARLRGSETEPLADRVAYIAQRLQISAILERFPNQISGGQRQRAALARALLLNPHWLILDEPNSALDVEQNMHLTSLLRELKARGTGIIFSTHLLGFAAAVSDRVAFLDQGRISEFGKTDILFAPQTERMARFVQMVDYREPYQGLNESHFNEQQGG